MTSVAAPAAESAPLRIVRVACRALQVAAIVSAAGIVFPGRDVRVVRVGSSAVAMVLGTVNDALVAVQYVLLLPVVVALGSGALGGGSPRSRRVVAALGVVGIAGVAVLQGLLAAGVLTFEQEIGPAGIAYIPLAAWFVATGRQGSAVGPRRARDRVRDRRRVVPRLPDLGVAAGRTPREVAYDASVVACRPDVPGQVTRREWRVR
jgi:hypothetical protein